MGRSSLDDDVERIEVALDIVGKDRRIMVDANQAFNRVEALRRGRVYQELGCFWYEEPLRAARPGGLCGTGGRARYAHRHRRERVQQARVHATCSLKKGADVVQPDNRRAGGLTEWMEIAAIADGFGVELASHGGGPANMNILLRDAECDLHGVQRQAEDGRTAKCRRPRRPG